jgi:hypothetical protein
MNTNKDGGAAFPRPLVHVDMNQPGGTSMAQDGMTLRDYFAAAALTGLTKNDPAYLDDVADYKWYAEASYELADAMLAEREKGGK